MRRIAWLLTCLWIGTLARAQSAADYAWTFPIVTGARTPAAADAWRVEVGPTVLAWAQDADLRDISVFNAAGKPVPVARLVEAPATSPREQSAVLPVLALPAAATRGATGDLRLIIDRDAHGRLRRIDAGETAAADDTRTARDWLLDASRIEHPLDHLVLDWSAPASGLVARLRVEASDDLQDWRTIGTATVLALEQDGARLEHRDIALGNVRTKYLRLRRLDDGVAMIRLAARAVSIDPERAAPLRWLDAALISATPAAAPAIGVTRFRYALPAALPARAARIELANANALAALTLSARVGGSAATEWIPLAEVTAFRLRSGDQTVRNSDVALAPTSRLREFRIETRVALSAPPRLGIAYRPDEIVFLAEGDGPYRLAVGSARARRADYPMDAALASLRASLGRDWRPPLATLGTAIESAGSAALQPPPSPTPWRRWLLWGVLVAAAALVGGFALSLLRNAPRGGPER